MQNDIHILESFHAFEAYAEQWNHCVEQSCSNHIYARHEWYKAVIKAENLEDMLHIILVKRAGRLIGIAPMLYAPKYTYLGNSLRALTFIDNKVTPENVLIVNRRLSASTNEALLHALCSFQRWDLVVLRKILENGETEKMAKTFQPQYGSMKLGKHRNVESPYIRTLDWSALFSSLTRKRQKDYRRIEKNIWRQNCFSVELLPFKGREAAQLEKLSQVSARSWKAQVDADLLSDAPQRRFYKEIMVLLGEENIQIWVLKSRDEIVAFEFLLVHDGIAYPIRADFDIRYKKYSPGTFLMGQVLKGLCEDQGIVEYHTCAHAYDYLMSWSQGTRRHTNLEIFRNRGKPWLLYHLKYTLAPIVRKTKKHSSP